MYLFYTFLLFSSADIFDFQPWHLMCIKQRYETNNAGQPDLTTEVNWKEASLMLWGSHKTPTLWWLSQPTNVTFYYTFDKNC